MTIRIYYKGNEILTSLQAEECSFLKASHEESRLSKTQDFRLVSPTSVDHLSIGDELCGWNDPSDATTMCRTRGSHIESHVPCIDDSGFSQDLRNFSCILEIFEAFAWRRLGMCIPNFRIPKYHIGLLGSEALIKWNLFVVGIFCRWYLQAADGVCFARHHLKPHFDGR